MLTAIKSATGIAVSILEKQVGELRRRLNATGDVAPAGRSARAGPTGCASTWTARPSATRPTSSPRCRCDEAFAGTLVFDEFRQEIMVTRPLPWDEADAALPRPWSDADDVRCAEWLQRREINVAAGRGEPQRRRRRARHPHPSGARLPERACAGTARRGWKRGPSPISAPRTRRSTAPSARCG